MDYDEFKKYFNDRGYLPNNIYCKPKEKVNETYLKARYKAYLKSEEKAFERNIRYREQAIEKQKDLRDNPKPIKINNTSIKKKPKKKPKETEYHKALKAVMLEVRNIDPNCLRFWQDGNWTYDELSIIRKQMMKIPEWSISDPHHIIFASASKKLALDKENIIMIPRYIHFCIHNNLNFLSEKMEYIKPKELEALLIRFIGLERLEDLKGKLRSF